MSRTGATCGWNFLLKTKRLGKKSTGNMFFLETENAHLKGKYGLAGIGMSNATF